MSTYTDWVQAEQAQGLASLVLRYCGTVREIIQGAREPGFSIDSWGPLESLVAVDRFVRIGSFKEEVDWRGYLDLMTAWAPTTQYDFSFKRITEAGRLVFLELEERSVNSGELDVVNSVTVYEFDENRKLIHLDVYLQRAFPGGVEAGWGTRASD